MRMSSALLVLAGLAAAVALPAADTSLETCSTVREYFIARKLTDIPDEPQNGAGLLVCKSELSCCTPAMEAALQVLAHENLTDAVYRNSQSQKRQFLSTSEYLRDHLEQLVHASENKTHVLFNTVYQRMAVMSREPLSQLYADLVRYLNTPLDRSWQSPPAPPQGLSLEDSINRFFAKLFPLTMAPRVSGKKGAAPPPRPLNATYEDCLASKIQTEQPFGDAPRAMALRLNDALEGMRMLLEAIRFGADVVDATSALLMDGDDASPESSCVALLTRLWSCPLCAGLGRALPCQNYCLNVLNGCNSVELARAWAGFVDAAAKLAGAASAAPAYPGRPRSEARDAAYRLNADEAVRQMENKISEAIMYAMENGPAVEKKVNARGLRSHPVGGHGSGAGAAPGVIILTPLRPPPPPPPPPGLPPGVITLTPAPATPAGAVRFAARLRELQASLNRSREFYADLPDVLCADKDTAAHDTQACWNGQKVDVYTNRVFTDRKYNLELGPAPTDRLPGRIRNVVAKLDDLGTLMGQLARRVQRPVQAHSRTDDSHLGRAGAGADSMTRSEEAEGSGGGLHVGHHPDGYPTDDEDLDVDGSGAGGDRGSGDGHREVLFFGAGPKEEPRPTLSPLPLPPSRPDTGGTGAADAAGAADAPHWSTAVSLCVSVLTVLRLVQL